MRGRFFYILFSFLLIAGKANSQHFYPDNVASNDYIGFAVEAGLTSFYGDIDQGAAQGKRLKNNHAFKLIISKNFSKIIDVGGRLTYGHMSGEKYKDEPNSDYRYFVNRFFEYTFDVGVNVMAFIDQKENTHLDVYGTVGLGLIDFKTRLTNGVNDSTIASFGYNGQKTTTEFVVPFGLKLFYHLTPCSSISLQTTLSRVNTDKLDGMPGNSNRDYYNFISIGYLYRFEQLKHRKSVIRR